MHSFLKAWGAAILLLITSVCMAQNKNETLTNAKIISMVKAALPKAAIISSIQNKTGNFDTSTDAMIALKRQGVPDDVITAMVNKVENGEWVQTVNPAKSTNAKIFPAVELVNFIYGFQPVARTPVPLDKTVAALKTKRKMLGYGGTSMVYAISGAKSPVRLKLADSVSFLINTGGSAPDYSLYKLISNKDGREQTAQKIGMFSGVSSGDNALVTTITAIKSGLFKITPATKLENGEYFFASKPTANANTVEVFTFGID